jgi:hypothetical protein
MKKKSDDWDVKVIGADESKPEQPVVQEKKLGVTYMVRYFRDVTTSMSMTLNAPVNGPALMKIFKDMLSKSVTPTQIYHMIDLFADDIKHTPLKEQQPPWLAFAARRGELFTRVQGSTVQSTSEKVQFDPRLEKFLND